MTQHVFFSESRTTLKKNIFDALGHLRISDNISEMMIYKIHFYTISMVLTMQTIKSEGHVTTINRPYRNITYLDKKIYTFLERSLARINTVYKVISEYF